MRPPLFELHCDPAVNLHHNLVFLVRAVSAEVMKPSALDRSENFELDCRLLVGLLNRIDAHIQNRRLPLANLVRGLLVDLPKHLDSLKAVS